jgi:NAD(P)-dependent dehydrogenase (short-subunit alcohol dehydrogenase family)
LQELIFSTGANSGIGYETVISLSKCSNNFEILLGCRNLEAGQKALDSIRKANANVLKGGINLIQINITDRASIDAAESLVREKYGKLDILINNAGIVVYQDIDKYDAFRQSFETNVLGSMAVTETFESLLKKSTDPYVIYVSSEQGSISLRLNPEHEFYKIAGESYRVSKAALNMVAACHRFSYAGDGIKVAAFNPGWCMSNLTGEQGREWRLKGGARDPKEPADVLADIAMGIKDEDIARNGMLHVDGGVLPW